MNELSPGSHFTLHSSLFSLMPRWTAETRLKQAVAIRGWMPWTLSTGPITAAGKARVARNGWKGGIRAKVSNWHRTVSQIVLTAENLYSLLRPKRKKRQVSGWVLWVPFPTRYSPGISPPTRKKRTMTTRWTR